MVGFDSCAASSSDKVFVDVPLDDVDSVPNSASTVSKFSSIFLFPNLDLFQSLG